MSPPCAAPSCTRDTYARGLCHAHGERARRAEVRGETRESALRAPVREHGRELVALPGVRVGQELLEALAAEAHRRGTSLSAVVREALTAWAQARARPPRLAQDARSEAGVASDTPVAP